MRCKMEVLFLLLFKINWLRVGLLFAEEYMSLTNRGSKRWQIIWLLVVVVLLVHI